MSESRTRPAAPPAAPAGGAVVVQTSYLGDVVLTTPLIAALAARGPVDVITTPAAAPLLANNPAVRHVLAYDKRGADRGLAGLVRFAGRVRAVWRSAGGARSGRPTTAYLAQGSLRSAALTVLLGVAARVGFETSGGRALYTRLVPYRAGRHHAERLLGLADFVVGESASPLDEPRPRVYPAAQDVAAVEALLTAHSATALAQGGRLVALAPGSVWATKRWPYYAALAALLTRSDPSLRIAVVGSVDDAAHAAMIQHAAGAARVIDATGKLSLLASAELIRRAAVLVTNDSAPQHLASAVGTLTITVFGPTVPQFGFGPLAAGSVTVGHEALACRPCDRHGPRTRPLGHWRCMRDLSADAVNAVVLAALDPRSAPRGAAPTSCVNPRT